MVEIHLCLLRVLFVVLSQAAIENDQSRVIRFGKTFQEAIVLPQVEIRIECGTVQFYAWIELSGMLPLGDGFEQHSAEAVGIAQLPMSFGVIRICLERFP